MSWKITNKDHDADASLEWAREYGNCFDVDKIEGISVREKVPGMNRGYYVAYDSLLKHGRKQIYVGPNKGIDCMPVAWLFAIEMLTVLEMMPELSGEDLKFAMQNAIEEAIAQAEAMIQDYNDALTTKGP